MEESSPRFPSAMVAQVALLAVGMLTLLRSPVASATEVDAKGLPQQAERNQIPATPDEAPADETAAPNGRGSWKEQIMKKVGVALVVMFFPPHYPTHAPPPPPTHVTPPPSNPPPEGGGADTPPPDTSPEPSTLVSGVLGFGMFGLFIWYRRRKS
jgi:hypothetical protein